MDDKPPTERPAEWTTVRVPRWAHDALEELEARLNELVVTHSALLPSSILDLFAGKNLSKGVVVGVAARFSLLVLRDREQHPSDPTVDAPAKPRKPRAK